MENKKNIAVWLDHSKAQLMEGQFNEFNMTIHSKFDFDKKEEALGRGENLMHNKENQSNQLFYKQISEELINFNNVLLFGPTDAKLELKNFLKKDLHFKDAKIEVHGSDKMTDNEKYSFAKSYFNN